MEKTKKHLNSLENKIIKEDEIDLIELARAIWGGRKLNIKFVILFLLVGIIVAFGSKEEYEASCKLMPESQEGIKPTLGGLGSLAGMAGINIDLGPKGALTPQLYPEIAQSIPFLLKILNSPIHFEKQDTITSSYIFFKEIDRPSLSSLILKYTVLLPYEIKDWFTVDEEKETKSSENEIIRLSKEDSGLVDDFRERISVTVNPESGIIAISSEMPDALASAEMANLSVKLMTEYITEYKISKAQENLDFVQARFEESKLKFENSQHALALFNDRNKNVVTAYAQTERQRLQNEYDINFEVYKGLATQLEQAKIKVKEETPVFTVLEPVRVPAEKSSPRRMLILGSSVIVGFVIGAMVTVLMQVIPKFRNENL